MFSEAFTRTGSWLHTLDGRTRLLAALVYSIAVAACDAPLAQVWGLIAALGLALAARLPAGPTAKRAAHANLFFILVVVALPLSTPGTPWFHVGTLPFSREGAALAAGIVVRANAILLVLTALVATMEAVEVGRAMNGLRMPAKLTTLLLFTVRYTAVLREEYVRLRRAMTARCFALKPDRHTLRSLGHLVGMLLVRGFERSERILGAMKCRGYSGRIPLAAATSFGWRDVVFGGMVSVVVSGLAAAQFI